MNKYQLVNYFDVLGNESEGWEVNNLCKEDIFIEVNDTDTDKDIIQKIIDEGFFIPAAIDKINVMNYGPDFYELEDKTNDYPYGRLEKMEEQKMNIQEFITENNIGFTCEPATKNPNISSPWSKTANHFKTTLSKDGRKIEIYFSQGTGIKNDPTATDVLYCIGRDSIAYLENTSFIDFCMEYGYNEDSISDKKMYREVIKQGKKAEKLLGRELLEMLVYDVEEEQEGITNAKF